MRSTAPSSLSSPPPSTISRQSCCRAQSSRPPVRATPPISSQCARTETTSLLSSAAAGNAAFVTAGNAASAAAIGQAPWWPGSAPQRTSFGAAAATTDCGMNLRPPGGFMSLLQTGHHPFIQPHIPFPAPWPPTFNNSVSTSNEDLGTELTAPKAKSVIHIDDGNNTRTAKRLVWDKPEDVQLVNAWLDHSNDPINGNAKKNESYWSDVLEQYNSRTPVNRKREIKHLKDRWGRIKKWVAFFCASWKKATSIYTSGYSDDQYREIAHKFYVDDYPKEGPFTVEHCWKILRDEPKWHAVLEEMEKPNKRTLDDESEAMLKDIGEKERPIGTKEAKKQRNGKGKSKDGDASLQEEMKKYMDIQAAASKRHDEFLEGQKHVSDSKLETARLRREAVLLESYTKLMTMDTTEMTDEMKDEHTKGLKMLRDKIAGNTE